jgi:hypothetical protein
MKIALPTNVELDGETRWGRAGGADVCGDAG